MGGNIWRGDNKCPLCGIPHTEIYGSPGDYFYCYECPNCGEFFIENSIRYTDPQKVTYPAEKERVRLFEKIRTYLFYHPSELRPIIATEEEYQKLDKTNWIEVYNLSPQMVENWYPKIFSEKIDLILAFLGKESKYVGYPLHYKLERFMRLFFIENKEFVFRQINYFFDYLMNEHLITDILFVKTGTSPMRAKKLSEIIAYDFPEESVLKDTNVQFVLSPEAWKCIYALQKSEDNNKNVFVSMAFNPGTDQIREAIRQGIINAGFSPEFIDEIIHNKQIVPEMFRLIRECRFLILDITDPNYGAYYEAGYALGLGKDVIICCSAAMFGKEFQSEEEKRYAKYLRPHFDIAQKQILVWKDYEDLTKRLTEWIKAIIR